MKDDICRTVPLAIYFTAFIHQAAHAYEKFCICKYSLKENIKIVIELSPLLNPPLIRFRQSWQFPHYLLFIFVGIKVHAIQLSPSHNGLQYKRLCLVLGMQSV